MGSEHLNEQQDTVELKARRNRMAQRHLARVRRVPQAQPASPPDGSGRPARVNAQKIALGLRVHIYRRVDEGGFSRCYWALEDEAFEELAKCSPVPVEGGPFADRNEAAENALVTLYQALGDVYRQLSTRMPSVRS